MQIAAYEQFVLVFLQSWIWNSAPRQRMGKKNKRPSQKERKKISTAGIDQARDPNFVISLYSFKERSFFMNVFVFHSLGQILTQWCHNDIAKNIVIITFLFLEKSELNFF